MVIPPDDVRGAREWGRRARACDANPYTLYAVVDYMPEALRLQCLAAWDEGRKETAMTDPTTYERAADALKHAGHDAQEAFLESLRSHDRLPRMLRFLMEYQDGWWGFVRTWELADDALAFLEAHERSRADAVRE
jgi:hypothetical protein